MSARTDELRRMVMERAQGAASLNLAYVGISAGLFEALSRLSRASAAELAKAAAADAGYVERWCDAAFAFELLDQHEGVFSLSELGAAFLPGAPGTLMPFAVQAVLGAHMAERAAAFVRTGERPGESVLAERETVLPLFGPMLEAQFGPFFEKNVLPSVPAFAEVGARGGLVVDLGCGNGWYLRRVAARFPSVRGVGLDAFEENVIGARERAEREGLAGRLAFSVGDLHRFASDAPADIIAMSRALHHVWTEKDDVFRLLREHLAPGGTAILWEPAWPDDRAALRAPEMRGMAFQNLAEHVQGNRFLRPKEIADALAEAGLTPAIHLFAEGREAVVTGTKPQN